MVDARTTGGSGETVMSCAPRPIGVHRKEGVPVADPPQWLESGIIDAAVEVPRDDGIGPEPVDQVPDATVQIGIGGLFEMKTRNHETGDPDRHRDPVGPGARVSTGEGGAVAEPANREIRREWGNSPTQAQHDSLPPRFAIVPSGAEEDEVRQLFGEPSVLTCPDFLQDDNVGGETHYGFRARGFPEAPRM